MMRRKAGVVEDRSFIQDAYSGLLGACAVGRFATWRISRDAD